MKPWEVLERTRTPDGTELTLTRHASEYAILAAGQVLMTSRMHGSEDALAVLGCRHAQTLARPQVLVGGLGMGFTLRAALDILPPTAIVHVAELVPAVIAWNRGPLGALTQFPLDDPRVRIHEGDVAAVIRSNPATFAAVLLDVDNGSVALTEASNAGLYGSYGLAAMRTALTPGGALAVWSAGDERSFERRLRAAGFGVQQERVSSHQKNRGPRHVILVAHKG